MNNQAEKKFPVSKKIVWNMPSLTSNALWGIMAGYIIERTNSKWGKGRPYSLCASIAWIFIILLFSVPSFFSTTGKLVYVFICYTLINSVALTFFNCSDQVYMICAIPNEKDKSSTLAIGGTICTYGGTILSIAMPVVITTLCATKTGWTILAIVIGVLLVILIYCYKLDDKIDEIRKDLLEKRK